MNAGRILVLGASGLLGHEAVRVLAPDFDVHAAYRNMPAPSLNIPPNRMIPELDVCIPATVHAAFEQSQPDIVINAVGITKQHNQSSDAASSIAVNSLLPHQLAAICAQHDARLIHISTDCVFSGENCPTDGYAEVDIPDAHDLYGCSKLLGELTDYPHALTLRTSIIGYRPGEQKSLLGWFVANCNNPDIKGYTQAIFSGLSTTLLTEVIRDYVFPRPELRGLYHVSLTPIDKYSLLTQLAEKCNWDVVLESCDNLHINRTLSSARFQSETGWTPPDWDSTIKKLANQICDYNGDCS